MAFTDYDKVSLLLPMDGANNGTTFTDWSPSPKAVTANGNAKTSTTQSKYYGSSGYFDGIGDYLSLANSADLNFGNSNFAISCWAYLVSGYSENKVIINKRGTPTTSDVSYVFYVDSTGSVSITFSLDGTTILTLASVAKVPSNSWVHLAVVRDGTTISQFIQGVKDSATYTIGTSSLFTSSKTPSIGANLDGTRSWNGYLQDLMVVKGAALWTANFTPPTRLVGQISGVVKDSANAFASRTISALPRTNPTRVFQTTSSAVDGTYSLRVPATEVSRIALANEVTLYNDIIDRIIPE